MDDLFIKGDYKKIDSGFISSGTEALISLSQIQERFGKLDTDTFINELRDSIIGELLGYELVNVSKHGFDCKKNKITDEYLEVKNASFSASSWGATFNDTTYEKALAFKSEKVILALGIWDMAADLLFVIYGQNPKIGDYLKERIDNFKAGKTVRSTQSISYSKLIKDYNFKIMSYSRSAREIYNIIVNKSNSLRNVIKIEDIIVPGSRNLNS